MQLSSLLKKVFGHKTKKVGYFTSVWYNNEQEELLELPKERIQHLEEVISEMFNLLIQNNVQQPFFVELTRSSDAFWKLNLPGNSSLDGNTLKLAWYPTLRVLYVYLAGEALTYTHRRWVLLPGIHDDQPPEDRLRKALALAAV
jgi:hypothetical protein